MLASVFFYRMSRDFFDPPPEQQNVVLLNAATLHTAERLLESCEGCNPEGAEIPFAAVLGGHTVRRKRIGAVIM